MSNRIFILISVLSFLWIQSAGQTVAMRVVEDGGTGPYKAVVCQDESLPNHTIYRPADIKEAVQKNGPLPVVVFANGGCGRRPFDDDKYNSEIASHGYILIGIGEYSQNPQSFSFPMGGGQAPQMPEISEEQIKKFLEEMKDKAPQQGGANPFAGMGGGMNGSSPKEILEALDWIQAQNSKIGGEYFKMVDVASVAAMGSSCGGLQAISICYDTRIKCLVMKNSGVFPDGNSMGMGGADFKKEDLSTLRVPLVYLIGNESDVAYPNATDDFSRITGPVALCSLSTVGHEGTVSQEHGGAQALLATKWLDWQLKGDKKARKYFLDRKTISSELKDWSISSKNLR
jgi:hypothetical protein